MASSESERKRKQTEPAAGSEEVAEAADEDDDEDERWVGPLPGEAAQAKKRRVLEFEHVYLENLPCASMYERSYMHRDVITHVACTKTDFIITASHDGHVKFWKKIEEGMEFVKHFRSHLREKLLFLL